jgi:hypothetical protein
MGEKPTMYRSVRTGDDGTLVWQDLEGPQESMEDFWAEVTAEGDTHILIAYCEDPDAHEQVSTIIRDVRALMQEHGIEPLQPPT